MKFYPHLINKTYSKRKIKIYDEQDKHVNTIEPYNYWYSHTNITTSNCHGELHEASRMIALKYLYWLLGEDMEQEEWNTWIDKKSKKHQNPTITGDFGYFRNEEEIELAKKSFNETLNFEFDSHYSQWFTKYNYNTLNIN